VSPSRSLPGIFGASLLKRAKHIQVLNQRRGYDGGPDSYRNTSETSPGTGPSPYATTPGPKTSSTRPSRDPFCRVCGSFCRLTPVSAHSSVAAGQMGSRAMVFGRPRYAGNLNALACVLDSGNRHGQSLSRPLGTSSQIIATTSAQS
jgi:hypothetical protein